MQIRNLDTFYWIATLRSFRGAAEKLNLTQPAISARIQMLEQDLGTPVFLRQTRNAELTPAGRQLLPFAEKYMRLEQDILAAFSGHARIEQTIRLGASETIVASWLPVFLSQLSQSHPGLSFDLMVDSTDNLRNALVARELDLAFLMGPVAEVSVTNTDLCAFEMIFAAAPQVASLHKSWSLRDIGAQTVLTFAQNTKPSRQIREMLAPQSRRAPAMTTSSSLGALIRLAGTGFGICAVPRAVIESELASGGLVELDTEVRLPPIAFTASFVSGSPISSLMNTLAQEATRFLSRNPIGGHVERALGPVPLSPDGSAIP
ncbi:LysR family transcriptional regulator [uncultured Roseobacter sp.]|uniref:LysR family transcriptional regulator n=1 Tax=uncultured Roseobacter sp. TaxID=114847 RepID=UPI002616E12D|nr:LysR family transcriptional regulator [uncultured Roseobacter sp.]